MTLRETSRQNPPTHDTQVSVRVLANMFVKGKLVEAGDKAVMDLSDAQALRNISRVEFLS
jgi:hypothetical protein